MAKSIHVRWECKYILSSSPSIERGLLYGKLKKHVGEVIKEVCRRGNRAGGRHLMPDHIHIVRKHSAPSIVVAFAIGVYQGKSAVRIHRQILVTRR